MVDKVMAAAGGNLAGMTVAILGLTFKPGTDDMRESVSLAIIPALQNAGAKIRVYDPQGMKNAQQLLSGDIAWCKDAYDVVEGADMAVLLTEWNEFRSLDLKKIRAQMRQPKFVDLRNVYKRQDMQACGFHYVSIGRKEVKPGEPWIADLNIGDEAAA
jgi:UDPglucose 6-dehydrogenase